MSKFEIQMDSTIVESTSFKEAVEIYRERLQYLLIVNVTATNLETGESQYYRMYFDDEISIKKIDHMSLKKIEGEGQ